MLKVDKQRKKVLTSKTAIGERLGIELRTPLIKTRAGEKKIDITLNADCEKYIRDMIKSGKYSTIDEVIQRALQLMREQEQRHFEELRKEIAIGIEQIDQGLSSEFDESTIQRVKDRARRRKQGEP